MRNTKLIPKQVVTSNDQQEQLVNREGSIITLKIEVRCGFFRKKQHEQRILLNRSYQFNLNKLSCVFEYNVLR